MLRRMSSSLETNVPTEVSKVLKVTLKKFLSVSFYALTKTEMFLLLN